VVRQVVGITVEMGFQFDLTPVTMTVDVVFCYGGRRQELNAFRLKMTSLDAHVRHSIASRVMEHGFPVSIEQN
jgi:hypothetical protein